MQSRSYQPQRAGLDRQLAFTLIELLVAIAIIGLLASLLLPALSRAKESGRRVTCMNNLHQMAIAIGTYSLDSRGRFPDFRSWLYPPTSKLDVSRGKLFPYLNSKAIYLCPTDKRELEKQPPALKVRGYSYPMKCRTCHPADLANYRKPAKTFLLMEANMTPTDAATKSAIKVSILIFISVSLLISNLRPSVTLPCRQIPASALSTRRSREGPCVVLFGA